jgi:signal transduction histidine kinase
MMAGVRMRPLVLVIDDSATYRAAIGQTLRQAGYDVADARSGDEGLREAARLRPDVLVVDHILPDIDGTAVIRNIRLDTTLRRTPCLLVTADDNPSVELMALETGADAYVRKDEELSVLLARVAALRRDTPAQLETPPSRGRRRIMLVPAGRPRHLDVVRALPSGEYDLFTVTDAAASTAALRAGEVACIVVAVADVASGLETVRALRDSAPDAHAPILTVQHADDPAAASALLTAGADDYVSTAAGTALYTARLHALIRRKEVENEDRRVREALLRHEADAAAAGVRAAAAERENEFKERFLAMMSHELRTPLNAILGFTQLLERGVGGQLSPTQQKHVGGVARSAQHLLALVNDVLDVAKIRAGKLPLRQEAVSLQKVGEIARLTVEALAAQRRLTLNVDIPADLPPIVGDPVRIQQILYNLLSNGIKFTPAGGSVTLTAGSEGDYVRVAVTDTGVGIRREDFGRLFQEFERLEHGQSQQADGTGLGLAFTRQLVELHGGRIGVESELGIGSTFSVWLPVVQAGAGNAAAR